LAQTSQSEKENNAQGVRLMLDEDVRNGLVDKKMTLDKVINDRILKKAQEELKTDSRSK
jgi:hypothetical protein